MASYSILKNKPLLIDLPTDRANQGWSISEGAASHSGCTDGYLDYKLDVPDQGTWSLKYDISELKNGSVSLVINGTKGPLRTEPGFYTENRTLLPGNNTLRFYSTGKNSLKSLKVYPLTEDNNARSLGFNEGADYWSTNYSFIPEYMCKFLNDFFTFKEGGLWKHNINPIHNNFYGVQYTSQIKFVANSDYRKNKMYLGVKIDSDGRWAIPKMITPKNETWPNGMKSRLHENNFDLDNGKYWADILRDMNDPQFDNELQALFEGRVVQGPLLIVDLESKETKEVKLNGIFIYSADQDRNF